MLAAAGPLLSVLAASMIAQANGCVVDEGSVHPCIVNGSDMGETLYAMGVLGWFMFFTIPAGALAFLLWIIAIAVHVSLRRRKRAAVATTAAQA